MGSALWSLPDLGSLCLWSTGPCVTLDKLCWKLLSPLWLLCTSPPSGKPIKYGIIPPHQVEKKMRERDRVISVVAPPSPEHSPLFKIHPRDSCSPMPSDLPGPGFGSPPLLSWPSQPVSTTVYFPIWLGLPHWPPASHYPCIASSIFAFSANLCFHLP